MKKYKSPITGHLDILAFQTEEEYDGVKESWYEVLIHGDLFFCFLVHSKIAATYTNSFLARWEAEKTAFRMV